MKLINIGFGNMVSSGKLVAIVSPESAPIKRIIQDTRDKGMLIDATYGSSTSTAHKKRKLLRPDRILRARTRNSPYC